MTDEAKLSRRLSQLMDGYLTTQLLHAASKTTAAIVAIVLCVIHPLLLVIF